MVRRVPSKHRNAPIAREKDKDAFLRLGLLLVVGLGLASGFVYAGRQHFAALKYGYETENLRREHDRLTEEQRRLILQREEAASPAKLEQAAKRLGMQPLQPAQLDPLRQVSNNSESTKPLTARADAKTTKRELQTNSKPAAKAQTKPLRSRPI
ncbi:MAG TPA: cell division protein FtsL [Pyrinomonadaceae bacterium]